MRLGGGLGFLLSVCACVLAGTPRETPSRNPIPQCGHWVILRCCQILGVPVEMEEVLVWLPPNERGHNMLALSRTLRRIGLHAEGRQQSLDKLKTGPFPVIAHLEPDHYVAVTGVDDNYIYLFDGTGRRRMSSWREFAQQWTGRVLRVWRDPRDGPLPEFFVWRRGVPRIQFQTLLLDKGEIRRGEDKVEFVFPIRNAGKADLIVQKIHADCACIEAQKPTEPIRPGGQGTITLVYKSVAGSGPFSYEALVQTNDPATPLVKLTAAGSTSPAVQLEPSALSLGRIIYGRTKTTTWHMRYTGDVPLQVEKIEYSGTPLDVTWRLLDVNDLTQSVPAREHSIGLVGRNRHAVEMSFGPRSKEPGKIEGTLMVSTNIEGFERITLPVQAEMVLPVMLSPEILFLRTMGPEETVKQTVTAWSPGGDSFRITGIDDAGTGLQAVYSQDSTKRTEITFRARPADLRITAGREVRIFVKLDAADESLSLRLPTYVAEMSR
jgi:hypothetical protein